MFNPIEWRLRALVLFIQRFGLMTGFRIFLKLYNSIWAKRGTIRTVSLPIIAAPLSFRMRTSDVDTFPGVFVDKSNNYLFSLKLEPKTIFDLGANVGFASVFLATKFPQACVYAVEPEESTFQMLLINVKPYSNIIPIQAAVWDKEGKLEITNPTADKWAFQFEQNEQEESGKTIEALTINRLLEIAKTDTIDVLKIDIEGGEKKLFWTNYESWLEKTQVISIELHESIKKGCSEIFYSAVKQYHFQKWENRERVILHRVIE